MIVKDLAARSARTRVAHGPEVVLLPEATESRRVDADFLEPDLRGLVVVLEYGAPEPLRRQTELARYELPRVVNGLAFEVVAEAEVAEHLEERVMSRRVADVLQIVVLAARAHAALRRDGARNLALLLTEVDVLELHHAGVREQKRRVVRGNERGARHGLVAAIGKIVQKGLA